MYNINWSKEKQTEVLTLIDAFFKNYPYAETILQSDKAQEDGMQLLFEISDIIQPVMGVVGESKYCDWDNLHGDHSIF